MTDLNYQKLKSLEDERKMGDLDDIDSIKKLSKFGLASHIPGTIPEKIIYSYLLRLRIRFQFQYYLRNNPDTAFDESSWIPDFILPDYNDTLIEVYGTYWHTNSRDKDQLKKAYWLMQGYTVIEKGIPTYPSGKMNGGKVVIWWDFEIHKNVARLVARDLPELITNRIRGTADPFIQDAEKQFKKMESQARRLAKAKKRPAFQPLTSKVRKIKRKIYEKTPVGISRRK